MKFSLSCWQQSSLVSSACLLSSSLSGGYVPLSHLQYFKLVTFAPSCYGGHVHGARRSVVLQSRNSEFDGAHSIQANLQRRITDLEKEIVYIKTHCLIYRHALLKTPHGLESVHLTSESFLTRDKPVCSDCEKDDLITALACLKKTDDSSPPPIRFTNESVSPILSSGGAMKRRKLMSKEKEEHHNAHR